MIEHLNKIDSLSDQISALLDLMMFADDSVDIKSIHTASGMCLTMHDELMAEVDKISKELNEQKPRNHGMSDEVRINENL